MNNTNFTIIIFSIILLSLFIFPMKYLFISDNRLYRLQEKSILFDWRFWIPCLVYTFLLGYRYNYAYDWWQYMNTYNYIQQGVLYRENTERGYLLINWILGRCGFDYYSIFILEGFFWIFSLFLLLSKERKTIFLAIPIVYMITRYNCLNISRQYFSMSILYIAIYYLLQGKKYYYWIIGIISCTIHSSSLIWLFIFFFVNKVKLPNLKIAFLLYFVTIFSREVIIDILFKYFDVYFNMIKEGLNSSILVSEKFVREDITLWRYFINSLRDIPYIYLVYYLRDNKLLNNNTLSILCIGFWGIFFNIIGGSHEITSRFMFTITTFSYLGLGIVYYYAIKYHKKIPMIILAICILSFIQIIYSMYMNIISECNILGHYIIYKD